MNLGYTKFDNNIDNKVCPICGKDIYVSKYYNDYGCVDINCPLGNGAKDLIKKISEILEMMK
jgi:hypothetical protein